MQIIAPALRSAVSHFGWTRIALLTQDEVLFTGVCHSATVLCSVYCLFLCKTLKFCMHAYSRGVSDQVVSLHYPVHVFQLM